MQADQVVEEGAGAGTAPAVTVPSRWRVLLNSAWHWDLWAALSVAAAVGATLTATAVTPRWWWALPLLVLSLWHTVLAASEANGLSTRLDDPRYGALIRITDPTEARFRAPYEITLWVSWAAVAGCGLATALFAVTDHKTVDVVVSTVAVFLVSWTAFCLVSLVRLFALHEDLAARADADSDLVDRYIAEHGQAAH